MNNSVYKVLTKGNASYQSSGDIYAYWVRLTSDPDGSLNQTNPKYSGDEVRVWTWFIFENGSYTNTLNSLAHYWWRLDNNSGNWMRLNQTQITAVNNTAKLNMLKSLGNKELRRYYLNMIGQATNVTSPITHTAEYAYFTYWLDQAFLPKIERNATGYNLEAFVAKHRFLTFVAYNDTNGNNVLDFRVKGVASSARTVSGTEATYLFSTIAADAISYSNPTRTTSSSGDIISWGFSITGLLGNMTPASGDVSTPVVETKISSVGFNFHFTRNSTAALVKVDEAIGQFNDPGSGTRISTFDGLSLAVVYYSFFEGLQVSKYPTTPTVNGAAVDNEGNSTAANEIDFKSGGSKLVSVAIGGDTYVWGNGSKTENAYSNTIPWYAYQTSFSELGNKSVVNVSFSREKSLYEACFPEWSGYSIEHDPYFAVLTYQTQTFGSSTLPILLIGGAGIGILLAAVTILAIRRRRKGQP
jgi:hypothetical protein